MCDVFCFSSVSLPAREPLVWSFTKIPCDGQTVVLLPSVVDNPGEFYCRVDNLAGIVLAYRATIIGF